jgi:3-dehydroquinate dehydratase-2
METVPMGTSSRRAASGKGGGTRRAPRILVLHGPNLNLLGGGAAGVDGTRTLAEIDGRLVAEAARRGAELVAFQSNHEGALIDRVHAARDEDVRCILVNPGPLAHTSIALRDALAAVGIPYIEIHLSNLHASEPFRRHSYFADRAIGSIVGLGASGYEFALAYALARLEE